MKYPKAASSSITFSGITIFADTWFLFISSILLTIASLLWWSFQKDWMRNADEITMYSTSFALLYEITGLGQIDTLVVSILASLFLGSLHKKFDSFRMMPVLLIAILLIASSYLVWWITGILGIGLSVSILLVAASEGKYASKDTHIGIFHLIVTASVIAIKILI